MPDALAEQVKHRLAAADRKSTPRGVEQIPLLAAEATISEVSRPKSGAPKDENTPPDPDLAKTNAAWPKLPEHIRQAVLALVRSMSEKEQAL